MPKKPDQYLQLDPWRIIEKGWNPSRNRISESLFSLGNEFMGVRGYCEEGTEGETLLGSYFNGIYEEERSAKPQYRGIVDKTHFMVNSVDWLYTRIEIDGERLLMGRSAIEDFTRILDMRTGILERSFLWKTESGRAVRVRFTRFLDMIETGRGYQQIELTLLKGSGPLSAQITLGADFGTVHGQKRKHYWEKEIQERTKTGISLTARTKSSGHRVYSGFEWEASVPPTDFSFISEERCGAVRFSVPLAAGQPVLVTKSVFNDTDRSGLSPDAFHRRARERHVNLPSPACEQALAAQEQYWSRVWENLDIRIGGDERNQQGIRFCLFQLRQTYHGRDPQNNIGAKGLTGEFYNGHAFWDTETYCLPFYLLTDPAAAKNLLEYRYSTLPRAMDRARQLDCRGACYPVATLNGEEACDLWQHASLQFQPSTAVAYAVAHYGNITGDREFLYGHGAEMLVQISRFLVSRGSWDQTGEGFGYYAVMGPDEFHMMVSNNSYTNFMARKTFEYTLQLISEMEGKAPARFHLLKEKTGLDEGEIGEIKRCAEHMIILYDESTGLYEQHEGYFNLPHVDVSSIPEEEFPLYDHWSYDRIYRTDMIKQPDVLMFLFLYASRFDKEVIRRNYEFYEPRTIHESSLSPSIHSIFASALGRQEEAFRFFRFATRMDLDNYNRNTGEGLHTTSIAAAWINIVYGFGGLRSDGPRLSLSPTLPSEWTPTNSAFFTGVSISPYG